MTIGRRTAELAHGRGASGEPADRRRWAQFSSRPVHPLTGKQVTISAQTKAQLEARLAYFEQLRSDLRLGIKTAKEVELAVWRLMHGPVTFAALLDAYIRAAQNARTRERYERLRRTHFAALLTREPHDFTPEFLARWIEDLRGAGLHDSSIRSIFMVLAGAFRNAVATKHVGVERLPWGQWRPSLSRSPKQTRGVARSLEELESIVERASVLDAGRRMTGLYSDVAAKIATISCLGLANAEAAALGWDDFSVDLDTVTVRHQTTDGWKRNHPEWKRPLDAVERREVTTLHVHPALVAMLKRHRAYLFECGRHSDTGPVFPNPLGHSPHWFTHPRCLDARTLRTLVAAAGVADPKRWTTHSLRDTFVVLEAAQTAGDLRALQARSRHGSIASLYQFLHSGSRALVPAGFGLNVPPDAVSRQIQRSTE